VTDIQIEGILILLSSLCWLGTSQLMSWYSSVYVGLTHISTYMFVRYISAYVGLIHLSLCWHHTSQPMLVYLC